MRKRLDRVVPISNFVANLGNSMCKISEITSFINFYWNIDIENRQRERDDFFSIFSQKNDIRVPLNIRFCDEAKRDALQQGASTKL